MRGFLGALRVGTFFLGLGVFGVLGCGTTSSQRVPSEQGATDPYLWLEEVDSPAALDWAKAHNAKTVARLTRDPRFGRIESEARQILQAQDRIPTPSYAHGYIYNFWQDRTHVRGIWRRASLSEYRKAQPAWEDLVDLDELARKESEDWVWSGVSCLPPRQERCLISLSRGGKDAQVMREFDVRRKRFLATGFQVPEAKSSATWLDENQLLLRTDWGPGSLTRSGYPRQIRLWKRGSPLSSARLVYEAGESDISADMGVFFRDSGRLTTIITRTRTFYESEAFVLEGNRKLIRVPKPDDAPIVEVLGGKLIIQLRTAWEVNGNRYPEGALVSIDCREIDGNPKPSLVFAPAPEASLVHVSATRHSLYVTTLQNVKGRAYQLKPDRSGAWNSVPVPLPDNGTVAILGADPLDDLIFLSYESFLVPQTVYLAQDASARPSPELIKSAPERFNASGMLTEQFQATSRDGTKVPYFVVRKSGIPVDGSNPTLLLAYGGFELSYKPYYLDAIGKVWLEKGGIHVLANIRGGGEFGPRWHQAAVREKRQKSFDDLIAVAEDLIRRGLTSPRHLGIMGGSNGGLLAGAAFVQRPDLFRAVVCQVPLLDMLRYHKLLAGPSWIAEYGDPEDPAMREAILRYSPYQNLRPDVKYPRVFFAASTHDDRVHPGHARKMVAKMESQGHEVLYFENIGGGHGARPSTSGRGARKYSMEYTFLFQELED